MRTNDKENFFGHGDEISENSFFDPTVPNLAETRDTGTLSQYF